MTDQKLKPSIISNMLSTEVRCDTIFLLSLQTIMDEYLPDELEEAFDDDWETIWKALEIPEPDPDDFELKYELAHYLRFHEKQGFLVKFACPSPVFHSPGDAQYTSSFGFYETRWFYAESIEETCEKALVYFNEQIHKAIARNKQKAQ